MRRLCALLVAGCAGAPQTVERDPGAALDAAEAAAVLRARLPLVLPGATLLHEVAIDTQKRSIVCVGRLTFPSVDSLRLVAQTPFGMTLFQVRCERERCTAEMASALAGRVPGTGLAKEIGRIYLGACPPGSPVFRAGSDFEARCAGPEGTRWTERIEGPSHRLAERTIHEPGGRKLTIRYQDWAPVGQASHPRRITLLSGDYRIEIALRDVQGP